MASPTMAGMERHNLQKEWSGSDGIYGKGSRALLPPVAAKLSVPGCSVAALRPRGDAEFTIPTNSWDTNAGLTPI